MSRQFELLAITVKEIAAQGGTVTEIVQNRHTKIFWSIRDKSITQVIPTSPSCWRALRNARSQVRRLACDMLSVMTSDDFKIGDTIDVTLGGNPSKLKWLDENRLIVNGKDERIILLVKEATDGYGNPALQIWATDAYERVMSGEAFDEVTILLATGPEEWSQKALWRHYRPT
jgi:hypothetical protein